MVNQDPEPKILTAQADFAVGTVAGGAAGTLAANTAQTVTLFTNQANNEQCTFYGMAVDIVPLDVNGAQIKGRQGAGPVQSTNPYFYQPQTAIAAKTSGTFTDFLVNIMVGGNSIPNNTLEIQRLLQPDPDNTRIISFSSPVLVLYQQPLQVQISNQTAITPHAMCAPTGAANDVRNVRVKITLFGENEIQKTIYA